MPAIILLPNGAQRLEGFKGRMSGNWKDLDEEPLNVWDRLEFPHLLLAPIRLRGQRDVVFQEAGWPCWLGESCHVMFIWPGDETPNKVLEDDSFHWAMRLTGLLGTPIDYELTRMRLQIKLLEMLADFDLGKHSLRMKDLLQARLDGHRNGFDVACEMLATYKFYEKPWQNYQDRDDIVSDFQEVVQVGSAICCLQPDDMINAIVMSAWKQERVRAWHQGELNLSLHKTPSFEQQDEQAAPYILKIRLALLQALRESQTYSDIVSPRPTAGCTGAYCENCFELMWDALTEDMCPAQRTWISREKERVGIGRMMV